MFSDDVRLRLMRVALGKEPADTVIVNGNIVSVTSGEIYKADIAVKSGFIALVGNAEHTIFDHTEVIDAGNEFIVPGLIDAHIHIESTMLTPTQFARSVLPHGTTTVFADFHEIANVLGPRGIELMINESRQIPLKIFAIAPSTPAAPGFETLGFEFGVEDLRELLKLDRVVGIDEVSNTTRIFGEEPIYLAKISTALNARKIVDGSIPGITGKELNAIACMGVQSDHEATDRETARARLRLGMRLMIRESSTMKNMSELAKLLTEEDTDPRRCILVADDIHPTDLMNKGHLDHIIRRAMEAGIDPITAVQMVTINPAEHFGCDGMIGSITPGRAADMVFVSNLQEFNISKTIAEGKVVAENGNCLISESVQSYPEWSLNTFHIREMLCMEDFVINTHQTKETKVRVIELNKDGSAGERIETLQVKDRKILPDIKKDIIKMAVIERHGKTEGPRIAKGFVHGLGIRHGAIGSSVAHDAHNIIVAGTNDQDMATAANRIVELQGGLIAVKDKHVLEELELPLAGIISPRSVKAVTEKLESLHAIAREELGCTISSPFMALSFQTIAPRSWIKLTDKGLFDGTRMVSLEVEQCSV